MDLGCTRSWEIVVEYDIQQRKLSSLNPAHDLSSIDIAALIVITTCAPIHCQPSPTPSLTKHQIPIEVAAQPTHKCAHACCFCCRAPGHFPSDCKAEQTTAGRPTATITTSSCGKNALLIPNGKQFCFTFACTSSCSYGDSCINFHGCSICGSTQHGASCCGSVAEP